MHYHLEVVMPPTENVEKEVASIMRPFDENGSRESEDASSRPFWDWYQIGGRWSGAKSLDVLTLGELPAVFTCGHIIIAGPRWGDGTHMEARTMLQTQVWNGVSYQDTIWDGSLSSALERHAKWFENAAPDHKAKHTVGLDWLVVTVDYHS